ncbi:hypothetical protein ACFWGI_06330 [Streptomyces niveus]|uniref:hypothetical protein n=1 Tax=Streptomyces niveus TaxID=193462 RepID=UPI003650AAE3
MNEALNHLLHVLDTLSAKLMALSSERQGAPPRLTHLGEPPSPTPIPGQHQHQHQHQHQESDPLEPVFGALVSINDELAVLATRLAEVESSGSHVRRRPRLPRLLISPGLSSATVRAARRRRARNAVPRA